MNISLTLDDCYKAQRIQETIVQTGSGDAAVEARGPSDITLAKARWNGKLWVCTNVITGEETQVLKADELFGLLIAKWYPNALIVWLFF